MPRDTTQRVSKVRVDNYERQGKVSAARRLIYGRNMQVNSAAVEELLGDWSGVPTAVSSKDPSRRFPEITDILTL